MQSKLAESEEKVAAMTVQIEHLHNDRLRLENRNSVLEKVCALLHGICKNSDCAGLGLLILCISRYTWTLICSISNSLACKTFSLYDTGVGDERD